MRISDWSSDVCSSDLAMQILVIEDDARVAEHIAKGLKTAGHGVALESDGRAGLLRAAADAFDLIVVDRMLPHVDGLTIVQTMRATGDTTPVLILSALGEVDERVAGLRSEEHTSELQSLMRISYAVFCF